MITMPPNRAMAQIQDRMPAILERTDIKTWLNPNYSGPQRSEFLQSKPCLSDILKITVEKDHGGGK
jgi:putative SOS response-associated peptidase YedK